MSVYKSKRGESSVQFIETGRAVEWTAHQLGVAVFPADSYVKARKFWRFCGECVSTPGAAALHGVLLHPGLHGGGPFMTFLTTNRN